MTWEITKSFEFCYGHRVHCQVLNTDYTERGHNKPLCRHLHGHQGTVDVSLAGELNTQGMVCDFVWLGWLKNFLNDNIDHKFILDMHDPLFERITGGTILTEPDLHIQRYHRQRPDGNRVVDSRLQPIHIPGVDKFIAGYSIETTFMGDSLLEELYSGLVLVDFVPTSENLSKWLFDIVNHKMGLIDVATTKVTWWETPKSRSVYSCVNAIAVTHFGGGT